MHASQVAKVLGEFRLGQCVNVMGTTAADAFKGVGGCINGFALQAYEFDVLGCAACSSFVQHTAAFTVWQLQTQGRFLAP